MELAEEIVEHPLTRYPDVSSSFIEKITLIPVLKVYEPSYPPNFSASWYKRVE